MISDYSYQRKKLKIRGGHIQTYAFGHGTKILLMLPSFPHSGLYFRWLLAKSNIDNIRVITFDFPGWIGDSKMSNKKWKFSLDKYVKITQKVISSYAPDKFSILGYSFGSIVGLHFAASYPSVVDKIVLVSPVVCASKSKSKIWLRRIKLAKKPNWGWAVKFKVRRIFQKYRSELIAQGLRKSYCDKYEKLIKKTSGKILLDSIYEAFAIDFSRDLRSIDGKKILIASSTEEHNFFRDQARYIRQKLKNEQSIYFRGAHNDFLLKPNNKVLDKIINFISSDE